MSEYDPKNSAASLDDSEEEETDESTQNDEDGEESKFEYELAEPNLITVFNKTSAGREVAKKIENIVVRDYESARDASAERIARIGEDWRLFSNLLPQTSDYPYPGAPNPHVPITMIDSLRMYSKIHAEIFRDWKNLFGVRALGEADEFEAEVLTLHGNWQLRNQMPDFRRQMERMTQRFVVVGDVNIHSWYDSSTGLNRHEVMSEDMCYVPYSYTSVMPDYSDVPFIVKVLKMSTSELEAKVDIWYGIKGILSDDPAEWEDEDTVEHPLHQQARETQGIELPEETDEAPHTLLWYEGWFLLPNQDRQRFFKAIVHHKSGRIVALTLHEEEDWRDRQRWENEMSEYQLYQQQVAQYDDAKQQYDELSEAVNTGIVDGQSGIMAQDPAELVPPEPEPPQPPQWATEIVEEEGEGGPWLPDVEEPEPVKMVPIRLFTHIVCIEPYAGSIGLSMVSIASSFNRMANTSLAQFTDQASFANTQSFLVGSEVKTESKMVVRPGGIVHLKGVTGARLKDAIVPLKFAQANNQLLELVDRSQHWSEQATSTPGAIAGEPGKSGEPYRGYAARIEQASQMLSIPADKLRSGFVNVLKNNAKLNSKFLPEHEFVDVTDAVPNPRRIEVTRRMYERSYDVELLNDAKFTTKAQRVADSDETVQMLMQMNDKFPGVPGLIELLKDAIADAFEVRGKIQLSQKVKQIPIVPPAPPQGGAPPGGPPGGKPRPPGAPGAPGVARGGPPPGVGRTPAPPPGAAPERGAPR